MRQAVRRGDLTSRGLQWRHCCSHVCFPEQCCPFRSHNDWYCPDLLGPRLSRFQPVLSREANLQTLKSRSLASDQLQTAKSALRSSAITLGAKVGESAIEHLFSGDRNCPDRKVLLRRVNGLLLLFQSQNGRPTAAFFAKLVSDGSDRVEHRPTERGLAGFIRLGSTCL